MPVVLRVEHVREMTVGYLRVFNGIYEALVVAVFRGHSLVTLSAITVHSNVIGFTPSTAINMLLPTMVRQRTTNQEFCPPINHLP